MNRRELVELVESGCFTRKADSWKEVQKIRLTNAEIASLPQADILGETPIDTFSAPAPAQFFIARAAHGTYLINTEGYEFARYAARVSVIPDFVAGVRS